MSRVSLALIALLLFTPAAAFAQEQRGSFEGVVKDTLGGTLAGATVEARGDGPRGVSALAVTDRRGAFRCRRCRQAGTR